MAIFVHELNYLAIPGIKNTNVQAADTVVLMPMTIYDKVWSLVCRHPARSSFNEGFIPAVDQVRTPAVDQYTSRGSASGNAPGIA
ncbi:hypothetical protein T11_16895 [Trichinella zimbabwensis]|uniref:Uncharacterized protein n=1 Tax=Trichinella zimbabwensis TaxID=268475 RepID=A0A0V1GTY4_9BILA|nr:hypothetical protein T11_16895 [Trichinella zimbabwensis]